MSPIKSLCWFVPLVIFAACAKSMDSGDGQAAQPGFLDDGGASACTTGPHCSSDLRNIVDCEGKVITTCASNEGCGGAVTCVAACDSAKQNASSLGCEFYGYPVPKFPEGIGCYAMLIANTWTAPVSVNVDLNGAALPPDIVRVVRGTSSAPSYDPLPEGMLPPGQLAAVFLAQGATDALAGGPVPCPEGVTPAFPSYPLPDRTSRNPGFHITTSAPITAYDIYPYGGAVSAIPSASLLLPTSAWGTNYVSGVGYPSAVDPRRAAELSYLQVGATEDGTHVTLSPTVDLNGGAGIDAVAANTSKTYDLQHGEYLVFLQKGDTSGTVINSDKPIAVVGGHNCAEMPLGVAACDSIHQQIPPVSALGSEYVGVRYRDRLGTNSTNDEQAIWRIVGSVDGTNLVYDPPVTGAPTTVSRGSVVDFSATGPFAVKSQDLDHPFLVTVAMTGGILYNGIGDPEAVVLVSPQQFLNKYVFLADPTYENTNLVFVRSRAPDGQFKDVTLDCVGILDGWQPVGKGSLYEYVRADLTKGGSGVGGCNNGAHTASSDAPFHITVWGFADYASYGYPAGMGLRINNKVVVPPR